jgi:hypothetical protein
MILEELMKNLGMMSMVLLLVMVQQLKFVLELMND